MIRITENLNKINSHIESLKQSFGIPYSIQLLAVSKLQPVEKILEAYNAGHKDFAENYVDELVEKASLLPLDIKWHMIGHIQSNKCKKLLSIQNLESIHSVDSLSLATKINKILENKGPKNIFLQVNTSGENSKSGINPADVVEFANFIKEKCNNLRLAGFMTIGEAGNSNDFVVLKEARKRFTDSIGANELDFGLSMGMSGDFEEAIIQGSTCIRVGSSIFGERPKNH